MKKIALFTIIVISAIHIKAQNYIPLNLDTSSFWINNLYTYVFDNINLKTVYCEAKTMTYVEKDTFINSEKYSVLRTYTIGISQNGGYQCNQIFPNGITSLIKEDSINHEILQLKVNGIGPDSSLIEFDHNVGDTLYKFQNLLPYAIIDSITFENFNGINRKTLNLHSTPSSFNFKIIEGIGSTVNFPSIAFMEFGYPGSTLSCYSKNGTIIYGDTTFPCQKMQPIPVKISDSEKSKEFSINSFENSVLITNNHLIELEINIYNIYGETLFHNNFKEIEKLINLNQFNKGVCIISVHSKKYKESKLLMIN